MPITKKSVRTVRPTPVATSEVAASFTVDYWEAEASQAESLRTSENFQKFSDLCLELKGNLRKIDELKKSGKNSVEIQQLKVMCLATMVALRKLNRLDKHRLKATRDAVKENRSRVDGLHLQLQNLAYEAGHLRSEVDKCLEFKSMHENIDLIPLEEFLKSAPEEIRSSTSEHEITMARLQHELSMRQELAQRLETSVSRKRDLINDIEAKEAILSKIQPTLNNILDSAQPLYSHLGMTLQRSQPDHANAQFLCRPLYVAYVEATAFQEVYPDMIDSVVIEGDVDEAKKVLDKITGGEEESDSDNDELMTMKKKKRKTRTSSKSANQEEQNQLKAFLKPFPLSVNITMKTATGKSFPVRFSYITSLKIVCSKLEVHIADVDSILDGLSPGDNGVQSPNPTTYYLLAKNGVENLERALSVCRLGKPYQWTQWLCGLDFLSASVTPSAELSRKHFEHTLKLIRERLSTRVVLNEQLGQLAEGIVTVDGRFPKEVSSRLEKFKKITMEEAMMRIGFGVGTDSLKEMMFRESIFFEAVIALNKRILKALVSVPQLYPHEAPFWFFSFENATSLTSGELKDLERTVNCYSGGEPSLLLSSQAMQALVSFEVMLNLDTLKVIRKVNGKDRAKPFNYEPSVGIFTPI